MFLYNDKTMKQQQKTIKRSNEEKTINLETYNETDWLYIYRIVRGHP